MQTFIKDVSDLMLSDTVPGPDDSNSEADLNPLDLALATDSDEGDGESGRSVYHCSVPEVRLCLCCSLALCGLGPVCHICNATWLDVLFEGQQELAIDPAPGSCSG